MTDVDKSPNVLYTGHSYQLAETIEFARWFGSLRDIRAIAKIADRLKRASNGNFGDHKAVKGGLFEMRIDYDRAIGFISSVAARSLSFCCVVATSAVRMTTLPAPSG